MSGGHTRRMDGRTVEVNEQLREVAAVVVNPVDEANLRGALASVPHWTDYATPKGAPQTVPAHVLDVFRAGLTTGMRPAMAARLANYAA